MNIFKKILLVSTVSLVALGTVSLFWSIYALEKQGKAEVDAVRATLMDEKAAATRNIVEVAHKIAEHAAAQTQLSEEERKQLAVNTIRAMRYNTGDYVWINTMQSVMVMHPVNAAMEGKDLTDFQDAKGMKLFLEFARVCREKGEGMVRYYFQKPASDVALEKLSYVKLFQPWGWVIGTGIYIDDVNRTVQQKEAQIAANISRERWQLSMMIAALLAATMVGVTLLSKRITRPIVQTSDILKEIAQGEGDLTKRLRLKSKDEIGQMAGWFDSFITKLHDIVRNISEYFETVTASANQLLIISKQMDEGVHTMSDKSAAVARAANEMSQNMHTVAAATEQAATNVKIVASTVDAMSQMVADVGKSSEKARSISNRAVAETLQASSKVNDLGNAAAEINKVTEVITEISEQTNLLALNATIEAARAGEAGKGFAVVANEIKELAHQTANATRNIKQEIEGVQTHIRETVSDISRIADVINEVDATVSSITTAVAEQTSATTEIIENLHQAAAGIDDVCRNVAQSSAFSGEIAAEIGEVNKIAGTITASSAKVSVNASDLTRLAADLKAMIGEFKVEQRTVAAGAILAEDAPDLITWDESIQFGIGVIDDQHHHLVNLVNKLHRAMRSRAGRTVLGSTLTELAQYTVEHFQTEEKLMTAARYQHLDAHKREHEKLVAEVVAFQRQFESGSVTITLDLMNFLSDWLINHIKGVDRRYVPTLSGK